MVWICRIGCGYWSLLFHRQLGASMQTVQGRRCSSSPQKHHIYIYAYIYTHTPRSITNSIDIYTCIYQASIKTLPHVGTWRAGVRGMESFKCKGPCIKCCLEQGRAGRHVEQCFFNSGAIILFSHHSISYRIILYFTIITLLYIIPNSTIFHLFVIYPQHVESIMR